MTLNKLLKIAIISLSLLSSRALALVDPEVDAWQEMVQDAQTACIAPGSELFPEALGELGGLASDLMKAPLERYMFELEDRRNLKFKYFTPWHVKDRLELRTWFKTQLDREYPPQKILETTSMLKVLGLVKADFQLIPFLEELLTSQVIGVYDPEKDQFFLVDTKSSRTLKEKGRDFAIERMLSTLGLSSREQTATTIVHELDHALGGQYFPLLKKFAGNGLAGFSTDQQMAMQALVEGDATYVMIDASNHQPPQAMGAGTYVEGAELMDKMLSLAAAFPLPIPGMDSFAKAPLYFKRSLIFPYFNGAEFVSALRHQASDWQKVDEAYASPPLATYEIFHPLEKKPASSSDLSLRSLSKAINSWQVIGEDSGGEFLLRVFLEQHEVTDYALLASGWSADRIRTYSSSKSNELACLWAIRWQSQDSASSFAKVISQKPPFKVAQNHNTTVLFTGFSEQEVTALSALTKSL